MSQTVTIQRNGHRIPAGTVGTLMGKTRSGMLMVDVPGHGRLAFTEYELGLAAADDAITEAKPMQMTDQTEGKRPYRQSGTIRIGEARITLCVAIRDLAEALGVGERQLRSIANEIPREQRAMKDLRFVTAPEVYRLHEILEAMREFEVGPKQAVKILAKLAAKGAA